MLRVSYSARVIFTALFMTLGLCGVAVSVYVDFWYAICGIILIGSASSFGERHAHTVAATENLRR
jgi:hypothetical protein